MAPREAYQSKDGKDYPLWINIDEAIDAAVPAYWSKTREERRERGWMFRGQSSAEWDMIPTLYRPPATPEIICQRQAYTETFINDLVNDAGRLGLENLYDDKLLAIAQHYGFYTTFLDFTWNYEVAAYFATKATEDSRIGVIYGYPIKEYEEMRNPFSVWGMTQEETDEVLRSHGMTPLPISKTVEFGDVPRIYQQEGLFVEVRIEEVETFLHNCVDRFYFCQQKGNKYTGQFENWKHLFPPMDRFDSEETYWSFIEMARKQKPELFHSTPQFGEEDLFPPEDPISQYAENWKSNNPDPTKTGSKRNRFIRVEKLIGITKPTVEDQVVVDMDFQNMVSGYYFDRDRKSPYNEDMIRSGRLLIERMSRRPELNNKENLKWLVWELLHHYLGGQGYRCTLRLGMEAQGTDENGAFYFILMERWLESNYRFKVSYQEIQKGWWCGRFDKIGWYRLNMQDLKVQNQPLSKTKVSDITKENPYTHSDAMKSVLHDFLSDIRPFKDGEQSSCIFDLQSILINDIGRELVVGLGLDNTRTCNMLSPYIRPEHDFGQPQFVVEIYDGFLCTLKRANICALHWYYEGEAGVNMLDPSTEVRVGLA